MKTTLKTETGKFVIVEDGAIHIEGMKPSETIYLTGHYDEFPLTEAAELFIKSSGFDPDNYCTIQGTVILKSIYQEARRQFDELLQTAMNAKITGLKIQVGCDTRSFIKFIYDLPEGFPESYRRFRQNSTKTTDLEMTLLNSIGFLVGYAKKCNIKSEKVGSMYYDEYTFDAAQTEAAIALISAAKVPSLEAYSMLLLEAKRTRVNQKVDISAYELPNEGGYVVVYLNVTPEGKRYETHENVGKMIE